MLLTKVSVATKCFKKAGIFHKKQAPVKGLFLLNPDYALENLLRLEIPLISRVSSIFLVEMGVTIPSSKNLAGAKAPVELLASKRAGDLFGISTLATIPNA